MAALAAAALLDELMGRDRNRAPNDKKKEIQFDDPQVCKHYLVKFCPNELFVNTRADLGPCEKIHDEQLKNDYEKSPSYQRMGYEEDFLRFCQSMLADVERRIRRGKQRLSQGSQEGGIATPAQLRNNEEKIQMLSERVNGLLEQVEKLGCEGKVEEAQGIMKLCDQLKDERESLRRANENSHWMQTAEIAAAQEKQMEVCEVCGAFLIVGDAQQRVDDHLMGKQHMGFAKIKATVDEILTKRQKEREEREGRREKEREEKRKLREEEEKTREREREERRKKMEEDRKRDRDRERSRRKHRSRSRDRKRSGSRGRKKKHSRSRSRDRRRSTSRSRRSDSREKRRRSRSRERRRSDSSSRSHGHRKSRRSHSRERKDKNRDSYRRSKERDEKYTNEGPIEEKLPMEQSQLDENHTVDMLDLPVKEDTPPASPTTDSNHTDTSSYNKWQVSGWTEVKQNGAKSEGDSEK